MSATLSPEAVSESVVVLADEWLLQLPLEALKTFAVPQITSISRDFSLQFHYHRVHPVERSGKRYIHEYIQVSSPFCDQGDVIFRNAILQDSCTHLSNNLHLKETPACLVILFLSDLCMPCFVSLCFVVLCLFFLFCFYMMFALFCFPLFCLFQFFLFGIAQVWSLLPNHEAPAKCSMMSGNTSSTPLNIINFQGI